MNDMNFMKYIFYCVVVLLFVSCNGENKEKALTYEDYQLQVANLIAQPKYSGDSMLYKITGADANLEMFYVDTKKLYFTCEKDKLNDVLSKLAISKDSVEIAIQRGNVLELDTKVYYDVSKALFKMNAANLKIDTGKFIETKYNHVVYRITIPQMVDFMTMKSNLRGGAFAITPDNKMMISHGVAVSRKGEPSLNDLVKQLTDNTQSAEVNAQRLLDFVTKEIEYNTTEASSGETIKRPDEILFTRNSDCSGKTILYASLLQQIKSKWCILYYDGHVCIGVAGNFHPEKACSIVLNELTYYIAETTAPDALIGEHPWGGKMQPEDVLYYQIPENGKEIIDFATGKPLEFLKKTVSEG